MTTDQTPRTAAELIAQGQLAPPTVMIDQDAKEALASSGRAFTVNEIELGASEKGSFWQFHVVTDDGTPVMFRLSDHAGRNDFIMAVQGALQHGPISGLRLRSVNPTAANQFLVLDLADTTPFDR